MYAWFDDRGDYLAREVRRKWNAGCSVKVVYSILNSKVKRILYSPSGRGRIPMRRVVRTNELTGEVVDYNHSKYVAMSGTYRHRGRRFVWSGSMNFTGLGLYCDDLVFRLHGHRVVTAYFHNFRRVWHSPKASPPIPTRAFGTLSRLAPVPDAAGLRAVSASRPRPRSSRIRSSASASCPSSTGTDRRRVAGWQSWTPSPSPPSCTRCSMSAARRSPLPSR